jgi:hypothetical protein
MKQLVTAGLSLMLGVGIGAGAVLTSSRLRAQSQVDDGAARLVITPAAALSGRWVTTGPMTWLGKTPPLQFIKDTKSGGCWIGNIGDNGVFVSIAVAPTSACD